MPESSNTRTLATILCAGLVCGMTITVVGSLETSLVRDLALDHAAAGLCQSAFFVGSLLGSVLSGWLLLVVSGRAFGAVSLCLLGAGNLLCAANSFHALVGGRLLTGLGISGTIIFVSALLVVRFPRRQAALLNVLHAVIAAGAVVSMLWARDVAAAMSSWTGAFVGLAITSLGPVALLAVTGVPALQSAGKIQSFKAVTSLFRKPQVLGTFALMAGYMIAEQGATTFFAAFAEQERQLSGAGAAQLAALFWAGLGVGRLVASTLAGRFSERRQVLFYATLGMGALASTLLAGEGSVAVWMVLSGALLGPVIPLAFSLAARHADPLKGTAMAAGNAVAGLGGALGPWIVGAAADASSLRLGLAAGFALAATCLVPFFLLTRRDRPGA